MTVSHIAMIIAAVLLLGMAVDILLNSTTILNIAAFLLILSVALLLGLYGLFLYLGSQGQQAWAQIIYQAHNGVSHLVVPALFYFSLYYPRGITSGTEKKYLAVFIAVYSLLAIISGLGLDIDRQSFFAEQIAGVYGREILNITRHPWYYIGLALDVTGALASLGYLLTKYLAARLIFQKKQLRYFLFGTVSILLALAFLSLARSRLPVTLVNLSLSVLSVGFAAYILYSVTRFKVTNIRQSLLRIMKDFGVQIILVVPAVVLLLVLRHWAARISLWLFFLVFIPALAVLFRVFEALAQLIDRLMLRKKEMKDLTEILLDEIGTSRDLQELSTVSIERMLSVVNSSGASFLIFNEKTEHYETIYASNGSYTRIPAFDPLFRHLEKAKGVYDREVISLDPRFAGIREMGLRYFETYHCQLIIPLFIENQLYAFIHIMDKIDNSAYTRDDKLVLSKFSKVVEVILNNLILSVKEQEAKLTNKDLSLASQIQESIFQKDIPEFAQMDVFAYQKPAKWVNGDYYLVEKVDENKMGLIIADVSGKGVPAALISMVIHSVSRSQNFASTTTNAIVSKINEVMTSHMSTTGYSKIMSFATLFCGFLDRKNRTLFYTNAAHFPMIIHDRDTDSITELRANAKPLGIFQDQEFYTETYDLQTNQTLVLYSDGITEANDAQGEEFSRERLIDIIVEHKQQSARELSETILQAVEAFAEGQEQFDDITLIIVRL